MKSISVQACALLLLSIALSVNAACGKNQEADEFGGRQRPSLPMHQASLQPSLFLLKTRPGPNQLKPSGPATMCLSSLHLSLKPMGDEPEQQTRHNPASCSERGERASMLPEVPQPVRERTRDGDGGEAACRRARQLLLGWARDYRAISTLASLPLHFASSHVGSATFDLLVLKPLEELCRGL
ncbi:hypothetical protein FA10DRAFT_262341 [Acaromyces ingoldii]|uniref:Uncharacterized protein n=1 Tax=Acaromyces ingoldii TaxID=215250 RepID=A0A316YFK0_9BASI|nr:hypothetical protein FA10DRAFT_262341 [Acaromyces ingoldii]PWN87901.1 hypothetical protein FA10DRAFT_262341 [Acaromyces ingoldii]